MASLNDSKRGKTQAPQTILSEGAVLADRFGAPPPAWSMPADPSWHDPSARPLAIAKGQVAADELRPDDIDALVKIAPQLPPHYAAGIARGMIGEGSGHRKVTRAINVMQSRVSDSNDLTVLPPGADGHSLLADARKELLRRQTEGRDFRKATGMGLGLIDDHSANLIGPNGKIIATLPRKTAKQVGTDKKFLLATKLLQDATEGRIPQDLEELAITAVTSASQGRASGSAVLFPSDESRAKLIVAAFVKLSESDLTPAGRAGALQGLAEVLFAEALNSADALNLLANMAPLLGTVNEVEELIKSSEAAVSSLQRGEYADALLFATGAFANLFGVAASVIAPGAASISKPVRATVRRTLNEARVRRMERSQAKETGVSDAARRRAQAMARRDEGIQISDEMYDRIYSATNHIGPNATASLIGHLRQAIGESGELYFENIVRRWQQNALIELDYKRLRRKEISSGQKPPSDGAKNLKNKMRFTRDGHTVEPDIVVFGFRRIGDGKEIEFVEIGPGEFPQVTGVDIKTGKLNERQHTAYIKNSSPNLNTTSDPQTLASFAYIHVDAEEWRQHLIRSLEPGLKAYASKQNLTEPETMKLISNMTEIFEVADVRKWVKFFIQSSLIAGMGRSLTGTPENNPSDVLRITVTPNSRKNDF